MICEYIKYEEDKLPQLLKKYFNFDEINCIIETKNIKANRVSNLAITIDKIMHVLNSMKVYDAPVKELTKKEVKIFCLIIRFLKIILSTNRDY